MTGGYELTSRSGRAKYVREVVLGLTTAQLADTLTLENYKVSDASVSRYETGQREVPYEYMVALAELADVSLDWLVLGRPDNIGAAVRTVRKIKEQVEQVEQELLTMGRKQKREQQPVPTRPAAGETGVPPDSVLVDVAKMALEEHAKHQASHPRRKRGGAR